jgi:hypothetical protein
VLVDGPLAAITTTRRDRQPGVEGKGARIFMLQRGTILLYPHDPSRRTWPADARAASARRSAPARSSATTRRRGRPPGTESRLSHGRAQARLQSPLGVSPPDTFYRFAGTPPPLFGTSCCKQAHPEPPATPAVPPPSTVRTRLGSQTRPRCTATAQAGCLRLLPADAQRLIVLPGSAGEGGGEGGAPRGSR